MKRSKSFARTKGHSFEREFAQRLRALDPTAKRNVEETQDGSVDIKTRLPLAIQCKCLGRWSLTPHKILEQAVEGMGKLLSSSHSGKSLLALGVVRISRKRPDIAVLSLDDFLYLLSKVSWQELKFPSCTET